MVKNLDPVAEIGARAMQIVADEHPERFTYQVGHLFLDGTSIGDALTEALRPETREALMRRSKFQETDEPMTDARALEEIKVAKEIVDRHADMGWLASYGHDLNDGFFYFYWNGRYEALAEQEAEA